MRHVKCLRSVDQWACATLSGKQAIALLPAAQFPQTEASLPGELSEELWC